MGGAEPMLSLQLIHAIIIEYSHFWAQRSDSKGCTVGTNCTRHSGTVEGDPSLRSVANYLSNRGYDGYFIGSRHLVPIIGTNMDWWDDLYEVCATPDSRIYRGIAGWCWFDVVFVLRDSSVA